MQNTLQKTTGKPFILALIFAVLVILTAGLLFAIFTRLTDTLIEAPPSFVEAAPGGVSVLNPPRPLTDFTLTSHTGDPISLSDLRGKVVLLSFGYTYCPDVCPVTLTEYTRLQNMLGEQADDVQFVFISVDGDRDTPERLDAYLQARRVEGFTLALTGTEGALRRIGVDYGLFFERRYEGNSQAFYLVDHTASTYLIDARGRLSTIFGFGTDTHVVYERMAALLR